MSTSGSHTIKTLHCPNGSVVHVVGTAHFSQESIEDVKKTVKKTKPNVVVLELCQNRQVILSHGEEEILREAKTMNMAKVKSVIRREGVIAGLTQSIFLKFSAELTQKLGMAPGGEFRAGYEEALAINARVVLGDRLIGITFKRALAALSIWQRIRFAFLLLQSLCSDFDITPEEVERLKTQDIVQLFSSELGSQFPSILNVFVSERDQILAYSLMLAANCAQEPYGEPVTVVGVMGIGHLPGIEANWNQTLDIRDLMVVPQPSPTARIVWKGTGIVFKLGLVSLGIGCAYFIGRKVFSHFRLL